MTKVIQSFQGSDLQPLNARLLRGEVDPWETLPLNNPPFHWARKTQLCQNSVFPLGFDHFSSECGVFPAPQRVRHHAAALSFGDPGGHPKSIEKRYEKQVLKKRSLKRPLGCHGEPQGAPGSQIEAKMAAKRLPKEVQKLLFFRFGWKNEESEENTLFTTLEPHRPTQKMTIFHQF